MLPQPPEALNFESLFVHPTLAGKLANSCPSSSLSCDTLLKEKNSRQHTLILFLFPTAFLRATDLTDSWSAFHIIIDDNFIYFPLWIT